MSYISEFIKNNILCIFFVTLGLMAWAITISARIASKKAGRFISGVPGIGGPLIIIGFLLSPVKWLALIGLLDFDMWYFFVKVVPAIFMVEIQERKYIPPDEFDGGKVIEYSQFNKEFEKITIKMEAPYADGIHYICRYIIIQKDNKYTLLKTEHNIKVIERVECDTPEECKTHVSTKVKWTKK
ncbi:MAG: hypothetical protein K6F55_10480 [Eubacterium sp.]|nr:hypothetical protein [Eubacterium sp.]